MDVSPDNQSIPPPKDDAHAQAADELKQRSVVREVWVQAVGETGGDPALVNGRYIELRAAQLQQASQASSPPALDQILLDDPPSAAAAPPERPVDTTYIVNRKNETASASFTTSLLVKGAIILLVAAAVMGAVELWSTRQRSKEDQQKASLPPATESSSIPRPAPSIALPPPVASAREEMALPPPAHSGRRRAVPIPPSLLPPSADPALTKAAQEVIDQYPYLAQPGHNPWLDNLIVWRDAYIQVLGLSPAQALRRAASVVERYRVHGYGRCLPDRRSVQNLAVDSASSCQTPP